MSRASRVSRRERYKNVPSRLLPSLFRYETPYNEGIDREVREGTSAASAKLGRTSLNNEIHLITGLMSAKEAE